jgi:hypothetical protein
MDCNFFSDGLCARTQMHCIGCGVPETLGARYAEAASKFSATHPELRRPIRHLPGVMLPKDLERSVLGTTVPVRCIYRGAVIQEGTCKCGDGAVWECKCPDVQIDDSGFIPVLGKTCGEGKCKLYTTSDSQ